MSTYAAVVKAPEYPPHLKHRIIFETFDALEEGTAMLLVNDHDPKPLYFQLTSMRGGQFEWEYVEQGPEQFQIRITKK